MAKLLICATTVLVAGFTGQSGTGSLAVKGLAFVGGDLIAGDARGQIIGLDGRTGALTFTEATDGPLNVLAISPDGLRVGLGYDTGRVGVFALKDWKPIHWFPAHERSVNALHFTRGQHYLTGSRDRTAKLWNASTRVEEISIPGIRRIHDGSLCCGSPVQAIASSPSGQLALLGCDDGYAYIWQKGATFDEVFAPQMEHRGTSALHITDKREWLWVTSREDHIVITTGVGTDVRPSSSIRMQQLSFATSSPDGTKIAAASWTGEVMVFGAATAKTLSGWKASSGVTALAFDQRGALVATGDVSGRVAVWNAADGHLIWSSEGFGKSEQVHTANLPPTHARYGIGFSNYSDR